MRQMKFMETKTKLEEIADRHLKLEVENAQAAASAGDENRGHVALIGLDSTAVLPLPGSGGDASTRAAWREGALNVTHAMGAFALFVAVRVVLAAAKPEDPAEAERIRKTIEGSKDPMKAAVAAGLKPREGMIVAALLPWGSRLVLVANGESPGELSTDAAARLTEASFPRELKGFWEEYMERFVAADDVGVVIDAAQVTGAPPSPLAAGEKGN